MSHSISERPPNFSKLTRSQFVVRYGVLGWGVPTAVLFSLIQGYLYGFEGFLFQLIPALVLFPLGGILWGRYMWKFLERKHAKATTCPTE